MTCVVYFSFCKYSSIFYIFFTILSKKFFWKGNPFLPFFQNNFYLILIKWETELITFMYIVLTMNFKPRTLVEIHLKRLKIFSQGSIEFYTRIIYTQYVH